MGWPASPALHPELLSLSMCLWSQDLADPLDSERIRPTLIPVLEATAVQLHLALDQVDVFLTNEVTDGRPVDALWGILPARAYWDCELAVPSPKSRLRFKPPPDFRSSSRGAVSVFWRRLQLGQ